MIKTDRYNNISPQLRKKYTLKPGKIAVFKLDNLLKDPDPNNKFGYFLPAVKHVRTSDVIFDPYSEEQVEIRAIKSVSADGKTIKDYRLAFEKIFMGQITLSGDNADHQRIYTYMMLCNENGTNPNRLAGNVSATFVHFDPEEAARKSRKARHNLRMANNAAFDLPAKGIKLVAAALDHNVDQDVEVLRDKVESFASENPVAFLRMITDKNVGVRGLINQAFRLNIIRYIGSRMQVVWTETQQVIHTVAPGAKAKESLAKFVIGGTDAGEAILDSIRSAMQNKGAQIESSVKDVLSIGTHTKFAEEQQESVAEDPVGPPAPEGKAVISIPGVNEAPADEPSDEPVKRKAPAKTRRRKSTTKS